MEILIFSDSHGRIDGMMRAIDAQIKRPDLILHLGDGVREVDFLRERGIPVVAVRGNCDLFGPSSEYGESFCLEELGHKIFMTHGHRFGVKSGVGGIASHAAQIGADIVLFGHTHRPLEQRIDAGYEIGGVTLTRPMYLFNPGSIGSGRTGGDSLSFGTLSLTKTHVFFSHGAASIKK